MVLTTEEGQRLERPEKQLVEMRAASSCRHWRTARCRMASNSGSGKRVAGGGASATAPCPPTAAGSRLTRRRCMARRQVSPVRLSLPYAITFATYSLRNRRLFLTGANELYFCNARCIFAQGQAVLPALEYFRIGTPRRRGRGSARSFSNMPEGRLVGTTAGTARARLERRLQPERRGARRQIVVHRPRGVHPTCKRSSGWEEASRQNDAFALGVKWKPAPLSVGDLMEAMLGRACPPASQPKARAKNELAWWRVHELRAEEVTRVEQGRQGAATGVQRPTDSDLLV